MKAPPKICMPRSAKMMMKSRLRMKILVIWDRALPKVITISYNPRHVRISRSIRSTRSIRRMRSHVKLTPEPLPTSAEATMSKIESDTIVPSSTFHPSAQ